ncbi:hypothetical protein PAT3040_02707 [Paenibacillus agaridevorans]|uniref:Glucosyltransferase 3-like C-terminal domain-containing protein n=1 Tax=Paenibacillus agaridevorans TaxID=171404 RepID=A0A2R5ER54_9BACL|nr:hypothetical protein [Paenibacillus agaridevorans]GBG08139.1 hypothetical protein PAT3040_02707 [Paenibacillus agaridevorans]
MKIVIINCFDTYENRIDMVYDYFIEHGHSVNIITSNFKHIQKTKRNDKKKNYLFIETRPYHKNLSYSRLLSHYEFSKRAFQAVEKLLPDLIYVTLPPNSLALFANRYKKKHPEVKLYFDIIDLWPETMPTKGGVVTKFPYYVWRSLRNKNILRANTVLTECNLYQSVLQELLKNHRSETLYLAKKGDVQEKWSILDNNQINLCYLGSINNIIDITMIIKLVTALVNIKPTTIHIIGEGENKQLLIDGLKNVGATVNYYGKVYDDKEKQQIFNKCHFGLNIMKESVCVGLTMKSVDYFYGGLPILNNIQADTFELVKDENIGFNININNLTEIAARITNMTASELHLMKNNTHYQFERLFSHYAFQKKMNHIFGNIDR